MKTKQILASVLALATLATACKKDDYRDTPQEPGNVQFTSSINGLVQTRVTGNAWDANDAIGVFMQEGTGLTSILASNKKYTTTGNGNFSAQGSEVINFPDAKTVNFVAYYPQTTTLGGTNLPINVATQSNQAAIDVLYASTTTGYTKTSGAINLNFAHKLAKVELVVSAGNGVASVNGLQVAYENVNTTASLNLSNGTLASAAAPANITAKVTAQAATQVVEAIVIPGDYAAKQVVFTLPSGTFKWSLPVGTNFESGKKYAYNIALQTSGSGSNEVAVQGTGVITDWTTVPGGTYNVNPDGGTTPTDPTEPTNPGTGTEQTLYEETFGNAGLTSGTRARVSAYSDYLTKTVTYTDSYTAEYVDIRATSTINTHVWFAAARTTGLKISGINTAGATKLRLTYRIAANAAGANAGVIKVKINNENKTVSGTLGASNEYSTFTIDNIATANQTEIEFYTTSTDNTIGYRIDDIKLVGTK